MASDKGKRCRKCKYYFLAYRRDDTVREFCIYPGVVWRYGAFNSSTPAYQDIGHIDVEKCKNYRFDIISYFMNFFVSRIVKREKI